MPRTLLSPPRRYLAAFSSAAIVVMLGVIATIEITRVFRRNQVVRHAQSVIEANHDLRQRLTDAETGQRGYVIAGDTAYLAPYVGAKADVLRASAALRQLVAGDTVATTMLDELDSVVTRRLRVLDERVAIRAASGFEPARQAIVSGGGKTLMESARVLSARIEARYDARLASEIAQEAREARVFLAVLALATLVAAIIAVLLNGIMARAAMRQHEIAKTFAELNARLEEHTATTEKLRRDAQAANEAKSAFLAMMSHDLRTPLTAIGGYADLLDADVAGDLNDKQREYVRRILSSNQYLLAILNDVLAFSQLEAAETQIHPEPVNTSAFITSIEPMVSPIVQKAGLTYRASTSCGAGACGSRALVDPEKLRQIVLNLLTNAVKYTPRGGEVEVRCGCAEGGVWIAVRDTGVGIAPDQQERAFKPFTQLANNRSDSRSGVGLGLAISRELARRMGGDIELVSEPGKGSVFTVRLPREGSDETSTGFAPLEIHGVTFGDARSARHTAPA